MERGRAARATAGRRPAGAGRSTARAGSWRAVALAGTIAAALAPMAARAQAEPDGWTGADKALHLGLSAPFGAFGATLAPKDAGTAQRLLYGTVIGALPGLAKELADMGRPGATASGRDMAFNVLGAALGAAVADCCLIRPLARGDRIDGVGVEYRVDF